LYAAAESIPGHAEGFGEVLRSTDEGLTWQPVFELPAISGFGAVAVDPLDASTVYVGGQDCSGTGCVGVVFRSRDRGQQWSRVTTRESSVRSIVIDYQKPNVVYLSTVGNEIWKSIDGGNSWFEAPLTPGGPTAPDGDVMAIDPTTPSRLYVAGPSYFGESEDGGRTWSGENDPLAVGLPHYAPLSLAVVEDAGRQTFYGGYSGVWRYSRTTQEPGIPAKLVVSLSRARAPVNANVTVEAEVLDQHDNWVADDTAVAFSGSTEVKFDSPISVGTKSGRASAILLTRIQGTATITVTAGSAVATRSLHIGLLPVYLPRLER
jgi:hypothetical protein